MKYLLLVATVTMAQVCVGQELAISLVNGVPASSTPAFVEAKVGFSLTLSETVPDRFQIAIHYGQWQDEASGFRCTDLCPDTSYRAHLAGFSVVLHERRGITKLQAFAGLSHYFGHRNGGRAESMLINELGASIGIMILSRATPFLSASLLRAIDGSRDLAVGNHLVRAGVAIDI